MPAASQADVRKQIAAGKVAPVYLVLGEDEAAKTGLASEFLSLVEPDLRPFNVDRLYGGETSVADVLDAARTLPMMVPRRLVLLLHAERLLNPKKETDSASSSLALLEEYVKAPVDTCCLVIVAEGLDKRRSLTKLLMTRGTAVECTGPVDHAEAVAWVRAHVERAGLKIETAAARLVVDRAGLDIARLRADVERLALYAAGQQAIGEVDVKEVVGTATSQDDWAVTNAIERGATGDALRELGLMMDVGAVPYMILGQFAWFARTKVPAPRVADAVEAVFRTDLAIKTSAGDPRVLLERLVVELCRR